MAEKRKLKVTLTVIEGKDKGNSFELTADETVIGRVGADIVLVDAKISRKHALVSIDGAKVTIKDMDSTNGVFVNDQKIDEIQLKNLDEITLGFSKLSVAIIEDLKSFKAKNIPSFKSLESSRASGSGHDIGRMIEEELARFSRWDISRENQDEPSEEKYVPKTTIMIEVLDGPDAGKKIKLKKGNTVLGRSKADVVFKDTDISRANSTIEVYGKDQIFIRDLASTNGTVVNGKKISYTRLQNGDTIQIGGTLLRLIVED